MKIVIVDDNQINLAILSRLASKILGSQVSTFTASELAIEFLFQHEVDLIVADYSMPKITGVELIKRMRTSPRHKTTPILMVTSSREAAVRRRAVEVGATEFLTTPVREAEFIKIVRRLGGQKPVAIESDCDVEQYA